jgi:hypothetical protein
LRSAAAISCCWVALRALYALQSFAAIPGDGHVSALGIFASSVGSALKRTASGSARHGVGADDEDDEAEPLAVEVAVPVVLAVGVVLAGVLLAAVVFVGVGATSGRTFAAFPPADPELVAGDELDADADADGELDGLDEAVAAPDFVAFGDAQVTGSMGASSGRKFRTAAWPSRATSLCVALGISTTSWSAPCTATVAPVTPVVLMRSSMICRAWLICDEVGCAAPLGTMALKMTRVPPTRSMPSFGLCGSPGNAMSA